MKIFLLVLLVIVLALVAAGYALFFLEVCRIPRKGETKLSPKLEKYADTIKSGREWFDAREKERIELSARDGTRLVGLYLPAENARGTVILAHGYRSDAYSDFGFAFKFYYEQGYSLLSIHQRACGESGGRYICFGDKERYDLLNWAEYIYDRFGPEHDIFLSGISMGASCVLLASGLGLPSSVRGLIADCGYTSPYEEFKVVLKNKHIPLHPFMDIAGFFCRYMAHFDYRGCSTVEALEKNNRPVLFIHGEADGFVPAHFTRENYEACTAPKELLLVPDAAHACSGLQEPERYRSTVATFLRRNASPGRD